MFSRAAHVVHKSSFTVKQFSIGVRDTIPCRESVQHVAVGDRSVDLCCMMLSDAAAVEMRPNSFNSDFVDMSGAHSSKSSAIVGWCTDSPFKSWRKYSKVAIFAVGSLHCCVGRVIRHPLVPRFNCEMLECQFADALDVGDSVAAVLVQVGENEYTLVGILSMKLVRTSPASRYCVTPACYFLDTVDLV